MRQNTPVFKVSVPAGDWDGGRDKSKMYKNKSKATHRPMIMMHHELSS